MKLFDIFKKKKEKSILERSLEEVERVGKEQQQLKGVEAVDEYYKEHPFDMKKVMPKKKKQKEKK